MLCVAWGLGFVREARPAGQGRRARPCVGPASDMFLLLRSRFRLLPLLVRSFPLLLLLLLPSLIRFVRQAASYIFKKTRSQIARRCLRAADGPEFCAHISSFHPTPLTGEGYGRYRFQHMDLEPTSVPVRCASSLVAAPSSLSGAGNDGLC